MDLLASYNSESEVESDAEWDVTSTEPEVTSSDADFLAEVQVPESSNVHTTNNDESEDEMPSSSTDPKPLAKLAGRSQQIPSFDPSKCSEIGCSVYMNELKREELLNKTILSQHVSLTDLKDSEDEKKKKMGPCRAFKRGDCRRGDKCRFYHPPPRAREPVDPKSAAVVSSGPQFYTADADAFKRKKIA